MQVSASERRQERAGKATSEDKLPTNPEGHRGERAKQVLQEGECDGESHGCENKYDFSWVWEDAADTEPSVHSVTVGDDVGEFGMD